MSALSCPRCKADTNKLIWLPTVQGEDPVVCCPGCRDGIKRPTRDGHLYTGRQFWAGHEVYTKDQLDEKAHEYEQRILESHKRVRPSERRRVS